MYIRCVCPWCLSIGSVHCVCPFCLSVVYISFKVRIHLISLRCMLCIDLLSIEVLFYNLAVLFETESKRAHQDIKKAYTETVRLKKKSKKGELFYIWSFIKYCLGSPSKVVLCEVKLNVFSRNRFGHFRSMVMLLDHNCQSLCFDIHSLIPSFIQAISIAPLQVHYYSEALPRQHGYCAGISRRSATGNCE